MARLLLLSLFIPWLLQPAWAVVWQHDPGLSWNSEWQKKYSAWVQHEVGGDFFQKLGGMYKEVPLDCADAAYALHIYFSYKHRLPWRSRAGPQKDLTEPLDNTMKVFDHIADEHERVAHLIDYTRKRVYTRTLAYLDTYPVAIQDISPGDIFMFRYGRAKNAAKHVYIVKQVNIDGTLDVLYSTQNRARKLKPLVRIPSKMFQHKPRRPWGFKRFKPYQQIKISQSKIPGASLGQYYLASIYNERQFFNTIEEALRLQPLKPQKQLERLYKGLCTELLSRHVVVQDAIKVVKAKPAGEKCLNYREFDALSTPSRDRGIRKQFTFLFEEMLRYQKQWRQQTANRGPGQYTADEKALKKKLDFIESIFLHSRSWAQSDYLSRRCAINFRDDFKKRYHVHVGHFYDHLFLGKVSWHPNDNIARRWGFRRGLKTTCPAFYGN